ncbi:DUF3833 family protein [Sphingomonas sp. BN140010]|uniref:DUF3833 family protein n=1 Tax=Sphingomonas arvum TaxID=2992113 RepID=A0ABT3JDF9_9SPHN|nr:DUF3833 family protein [Sphingomonas sp. BN140010]MCW3797103.1 DUF3833 family protein [Sphingomonas sp. BN140010]
MTALAGLACTSSLSAEGQGTRPDPMRFFEGRTEMVSTVKVVMSKPYRSRTLGQGRLLDDGSLALVQQVQDEGKPAASRRWKIRKIDDDSFAGTMSEAVGPVMVQEVGGRYRFNFKMKGNLAVEQWVTPMADGRTAKSSASVKKFGMRVATSEGFIRRL